MIKQKSISAGAMRPVSEIIIHCSATPEGRAVTVKEIDRWHRQRGFAEIGYHYVIYLDGTVAEGRPIDKAGAHCSGHNARSVGICYVGGCDRDMKPKDTRTSAQRKALISLVDEMKKRFPGATVHGHNEFAAKACPSFDVGKEFR